jgi:transposase-like protein
VLCVETIGKIRRRRLVQGESISAIARDLGLLRNTVKRALRSEGERFEYRRSSQPRPKLGPFLETLEAWLEAETGQVEKKPGDPRSRESLDRRSRAFLCGRILKDPGASAANVADRASSIHQMKSDTEEPSNNRPTLVNVGRRKVVQPPPKDINSEC